MTDTIYRAEKQTDEAKKPGQIINRPVYNYRDNILHNIEEYRATLRSECCHKTKLIGDRCEGCPYDAH